MKFPIFTAKVFDKEIKKMKLLLVEDDAKLGAVVQKLLTLENFQTDWAQDGKEALEFVRDNRLNAYDVIILDWMLPEISGIEICRILRDETKYNYQGGIIFVTAKDSTEDCINGLNAGADDYIVKPFQTDELIARVNAVSRRKTKPFIDDVYTKGALTLNNTQNTLSYQGKELALSRKEFNLFRLLFINNGQVLPRATIFDKVWPDKLDTGPASLDSHIYMLRKKLKDFAPNIKIKLIKNIGYVMEISRND